MCPFPRVNLLNLPGIPCSFLPRLVVAPGDPPTQGVFIRIYRTMSWLKESSQSPSTPSTSQSQFTLPEGRQRSLGPVTALNTSGSIYLCDNSRRELREASEVCVRTHVAYPSFLSGICGKRGKGDEGTEILKIF